MKDKNKLGKRQDLVIVMLLSLILGAGGGYAVGALTGSNDNLTAKTTEATEDEPSHSHSSMYTVDEVAAPSVEVSVTEDAKSGYNVKLTTKKFAFTPEEVNAENVIGQGHAHLYVDGNKIARLYGPYFHYDGSFEGTKTFRVTLNANDHSEYAVDGEVIAAETKVTHDSSSENHTNSHSDM